MDQYFRILFLSLIVLCNGQKSLNIGNGVQVTYTNKGTATDFVVKSKMTNTGTSQAWLAIGFSQSGRMAGSNIVFCKNTATGTSVDHRISRSYSEPEVFSSPQQGLTNTKVQVVNGELVCSFTRQNSFASNTDYWDLSKSKPYVIAAYGTVTSSGCKCILISSYRI